MYGCGFPICFIRSSRFSPKFQRNITGLSPEFTGCSLEFRQDIELEHLKKGDSHNSAFPQSCLKDLLPHALTLLNVHTLILCTQHNINNNYNHTANHINNLSNI